MAFVRAFENDIFISYAHVDNLTVDDDEKGWIDQLNEHLEVGLNKRFGRIGIIKIWRDPSLDGSQLFDKTIQDKINSSALFLALSSPGYFASDYCRQELQWFCKKAREEGAGLVVGDRYRIFNILLSNIPHEDWPEEYGGTSGFTFHDAERQDEFGQPLDPKSNKFREQLRHLVDGIYKGLKALSDVNTSLDMKRKEIGNGVLESENDEDSFTLFFADVPDTLRQTRNRIINDLKNKHSDIHIISDVPPPYEARKHEEKVVEMQRKSHLSIHLLDNLPGREIEGEAGKCYPHKQAELGLQHASSQYIWVPKKLDIHNIEDDFYRNFIDHLENGTRGAANHQFIRGLCSPSSIMQGILEEVEHLKARPKSNSASPASGVLLDTHRKDELYAVELYQYLLKKKIKSFLNPEEDDPQKNMKLLEERLKQVNTLIIVFGQVAKDWVVGRLMAALNLICAKNYQLETCSIYLAPPEKKTDDKQFSQRFLKLHVLDNSNRNKFDPQTLSPLLESLGPGTDQ